MTLLDAVRDRLSSRDATAQSDSASAPAVADAELPFAGYENLDDREVMAKLSQHSQTELSNIEDYERAHKKRPSVLDKLRFMRGREPLPGYDAMSADEVVAVIAGADREAIKRIRAYERKFAKRPDIMEAVSHAMHERQTSEPAPPPPAYQPSSAD